MRRIGYLLYIQLVCVIGCTNLDDAELSRRSTFIRIYDGPSNFIAKDVLTIDGGYLILGNRVETDGTMTAALIKTDEQGNKVDTVHYFPGGSGNIIKPFANSQFTGYLIIGDSIKIDPNASQVGNIEIASARLLAIRDDLTEFMTLSISDTTNNNPGDVKIDIRGSSMTVADNGNVILLLSYKPEGSTEKPWLISLTNDFAMDWDYRFDALVRDYVGGRSVFHYNNKAIWASSLLREQGNFNEKYVSIIRVEDYLSPDNYSLLGETLNKSISANDICPAKHLAFGFGVIGTYSETDGANKNMFFTTVDTQGNIKTPLDTIFIDGFSSMTTSTSSQVDDTGETLCNTSDGNFILAGTALSQSVDGKAFGNGFRDILLVKINPLGKLVWKQLIGGSGDEVVAAIRETDDNGLLICGTNTVSGYSSIFLIKTDRNGELKN